MLARSLLSFALLLLTPPHTAHAKSFVLQAARLYDGRTDTLQRMVRLVVENGKITGVGAQAKAPADAELIELGDATLMPGLMDAPSCRR